VADLIKNTLGLEVLTDSGWSRFDGVITKGTKQVACLTLRNGTALKATLDHEIYDPDLNQICLKDLEIGHDVLTSSGTVEVQSIVLLQEEQVYDLLNVAKNHRFYANDILVSNCEFIINDETLIAPAKLIDLRGDDPLFRTGHVRWYKKPQKGQIYVVALDPSLGTGSDPAAIQVFEATTTEQIAEWRHNRTTIPEQIRILADIIKYINETVDDTNSIYFSVENNTIGEAALISIAEYGEENIKGYFLSDTNSNVARRFRKGFNTTAKAKLTACNKLKILIETGRMKIHSAPLVSELKTFVAHGVSYAAKPGETDDLVMSTILAVRMMQQLQSYHPEMDKQMKDHADNIIEPFPFIAVMS